MAGLGGVDIPGMIDRRPNRIRELRTARGWSQHTLAVAARITAKTVYRIERGEPPSFDAARAIAAALETSVEDVFPDRDGVPS